MSAVAAVGLSRHFQPPKIIIQEAVPARYAAYEDPAAGNSYLASTPRTIIAAPATDFIAAAEEVTPTVVNIKTIQGGRTFDLWSGSGISASSGSGVIISPDGFIVTNSHVVEGADEIQVTLNDRREFSAKLIGADASTDLALIKVESGDLPYLGFGNSDSLRIGEWVLAVGNPFNLESTVTAGIVSAKGRTIDILESQDRIESFIQTDAAVNPGNSGGALVNTSGDLIGINTAIMTRSGRYEGYSFAVPANLVRKVVRDLRDFGEVQRGMLGVFIRKIDDQLAKKLGLNTVEGIYISAITPGGGADEAGIREGDVILGINGVKTRTPPEMQEQVGRYRPGNLLTVEYFREGKVHETRVLLKTKSNALPTSSANILKKLGFELNELSPDDRKKFKAKGVRVTSIFNNSIIEGTNMDPGFIITKVDEQPVSSIEEVVQLLEAAKGKVFLEGFYEHYAGEYYYSFKID